MREANRPWGARGASTWLVGVCLVGCGASGSGAGVVSADPAVAGESGDVEKVRVSWDSNTGTNKGTMNAVVNGGTEYEGHFTQILGQLSPDRGIDPHFQDYFGDEFPASEKMGPDFTSDKYWFFYSGRVISVMETASGDKMRCVFTLQDVDAGLPGGGRGTCQTTDGAIFDPVELDETR